MKNSLLTIAVSLTLVAPLAPAADGSCEHNFTDRQQAMQARFAARQAEMEKMRAGYQQPFPFSPYLQAPVAQPFPAWSNNEAAMKAQQAQFQAMRERQEAHLKQMQQQMAQAKPWMPSMAEAQKQQQAHLDQLRAQQDKQVKALRAQNAQRQAARPQPPVAPTREAQKALVDNLRQQQMQQIQAFENQMKQMTPGLYPANAVNPEALRNQTPEQRQAYFKDLAVKQQAQAQQAEFAKQQAYINSQRGQFEQFSPVTQMPYYQAFQAEANKRRAQAEQRHQAAEKSRKEREACAKPVK